MRIEAWLPQEVPAVTARLHAVVTVNAKEFHRFPIVYDVDINDQNEIRRFSSLRAFSDKEVDELARFVLGRGHRPHLKRLELRSRWYQLWRPENKINILRRSYLPLLPRVLVLAAIVLFFVSPLVTVLALVVALVVYIIVKRRKTVVLSSGKPMAEPREFRAVDSWHAVVPGLGPDAALLRQRMAALLEKAPIRDIRFWDEDIARWGLDGHVERNQLILTLHRGWVFCQIYAYDNELFVGWDAHLNVGQWTEKPIAWAHAGDRVPTRRSTPRSRRSSRSPPTTSSTSTSCRSGRTPSWSA